MFVTQKGSLSISLSLFYAKTVGIIFILSNKKNSKKQGHKMLNQKRWLTPMEFELEYGMKKKTQAKKRMKSSKSGLPFSKIGGMILYDRQKVDEWITKHQVGGL
jgi:hypothetical protein